MSKRLILDKCLFGQNGTIELKRGDDWLLTGKVSDSCSQEVDLTGYSATAYFPHESGSGMATALTLTVPECGRFSASLGRSETAVTARIPDGARFYARFESPYGLIETISTDDQVLQIEDIGFSDC